MQAITGHPREQKKSSWRLPMDDDYVLEFRTLATLVD
jgi:hypothetical protein